MITSIEPGLYRPGHWGIRIENLVLNVPAARRSDAPSSASSSSSRRSPCARSTRAASSAACCAPTRSTGSTRYHATVRERLAPLVEGAALAWLLERTEAF